MADDACAGGGTTMIRAAHVQATRQVSNAALLAMGVYEARAPEKFGGTSGSVVSDPEGHEIELLQLPTTAYHSGVCHEVVRS